MSIFAVGASLDRSDDRLVVAIVLIGFYLFAYPLFIAYIRYKRNRRIKSHLITSAYKLPIKLTPAETAYVFSSKINRRHLYATLLDLANRSILHMENSHGKTTVKMGPKVDNSLKPFELVLVSYVHSASGPVSIDSVIEGTTNFKPSGEKAISGSKSYVFWWLLRNYMQKSKIIFKNMSKTYFKMLFVFGAVWSLILSIGSVSLWRLMVMLNEGEVDINMMYGSIGESFNAWLIAALPVFIVSFFLLRYRGLMLGRQWLFTPKFKHYLGQIESFREYVRLIHTGKKVRFESAELKKESKASTKPYAIAFGYEKE